MRIVGEDSGKDRPVAETHARGHPEAWIWAEAGSGAPCCGAQADGFPCPELMPDCTRCAEEMLMTQGWSARLAPWLVRPIP